MFGKDLDEVFAYQTPKVVILKDRMLGLIAIGLKVAIFLYIFVFQILYQGVHLYPDSIDGMFRVSLRNPTDEMCDPFLVGCNSNFSSATDLAYCAQSSLPYPGEKRICQMWDAVEVYLPLDEGILLPTHITRYDQVRSCLPSEENDWSCNPAPYQYVQPGLEGKEEQVQEKPGEAAPKYDVFIADIEKFTVMVDHNFRKVFGQTEDDSDMVGHYMACPSADSTWKECKQHAIPCVGPQCPPGSVTLEEKTPAAQPKETFFIRLLRGGKWKAPQAQTPNVGVKEQVNRLAHSELTRPGGVAVAMPAGDVFTVGSLLALANTSLDEHAGELKPKRAKGLILAMHIHYGNDPGAWKGLKILPWNQGSVRPTYTYQFTTRAADYRLTKTYNDPADSKRTIRTFYGVRLVVEQSGILHVFEMSHFLTTVTTALALLAVANTVTDMLMLYLLPLSPEYKKRKFAESKDFNPEGDEAVGPPTTKNEAGQRFLEALEAQDGEALADAAPYLVDLGRQQG